MLVAVEFPTFFRPKIFWEKKICWPSPNAVYFCPPKLPLPHRTAVRPDSGRSDSCPFGQWPFGQWPTQCVVTLQFGAPLQFVAYLQTGCNSLVAMHCVWCMDALRCAYRSPTNLIGRSGRWTHLHVGISYMQVGISTCVTLMVSLTGHAMKARAHWSVQVSISTCVTLMVSHVGLQTQMG